MTSARVEERGGPPWAEPGPLPKGFHLGPSLHSHSMLTTHGGMGKQERVDRRVHGEGQQVMSTDPLFQLFPQVVLL